MRGRSMAIVAAGALPLAAMAMGGAEVGRAGSSQGTGGGSQLGSSTGMSAAGIIDGTVESVNVGRGTVTVRSGAGEVTVNALPGRIAQLNAGDVVSLQYGDFNGALWAIEPGGASQQQAMANLPFTNQGRLTGAIKELGRAQGTITVRGATFRIHPQQVEGLSPGQLVSVEYARVGGTNWVTAITPAQSAPSARQSGTGGGRTGGGGGVQGGAGAGGTGAGASGGAGKQ